MVVFRLLLVLAMTFLVSIISQDGLKKDQKVVLLATGDVSLARSVNTRIQKYQDPTWPFAKTADVLKEAHLTLINLESPLVSHCPLTDTGMKFCGDIGNVAGLTFAGVDVANVANNHTKNYGETGLVETVEALEKNGILVSGWDRIVYKRVGGMTFAFVGYNDIGEEEKNFTELREARTKADVVVVSYHWGVEYAEQPSARQRTLARAVIDAGADLVIGNHPHWVQPTEIYRDKLIVYAHGNFVFDQEWSQKTKEGVVGQYTFEKNKLVNWQLLPVEIADFGQPYFVGLSKN
jgi:poly-gamma-glutamate synthesis protein (capsule biosynthesis protein)